MLNKPGFLWTKPESASQLTVAEDSDEKLQSSETLAIQGDVDSFVILYRLHLKAVHNYLYARLGNRQEAEDLTSSVFERAWRSLKNYKPTGSFKGWLFRIVQRTLADYYRQRKTITIPLDYLAEILLDSAKELEETFIRTEQLQRLQQAVQNLSQEQQHVINLRFVAELRYNEIAQALGKSESAVKMITYRALEELRGRCNDVI